MTTDLVLHVDFYQRLAGLVDIKPALLCNLGYQSVLSTARNANQLLRAFSQTVRAYHLAPRQPRYCAECFRAAPYLRRLWDLNAYQVCHLHQCYLESAHGLELLTRWQHLEQSANDIRIASANSNPPTLIECQIAGVIAIAAGIDNEVGKQLLVRVPEFSNVKLGDLFNGFCALLTLVRGPKNGSYKSSFLEPSAAHNSMRLIAEILGECWPLNIDNYFWHAIKEKTLGKICKAIPEGPFEARLISSLVGFGRDLVGYSHLKSRLLEKAYEQSSYVSSYRGAIEVGCSPQVFLRALKRAKVPTFSPIAQKTSQKPWRFLDRMDLSKVALEVDSCRRSSLSAGKAVAVHRHAELRALSNKEIAERLDIPAITVSRLRQQSVLGDVVMRDSGRLTPPVRAAALDDFLSALECRALSEDMDGLLPITRVGQRIGFWLGELIVLVQVGELKVRAIDSSRKGLNRLLLSQKDVRILRDRYLTDSKLRQSLTKFQSVSNRYRRQGQRSGAYEEVPVPR